MKVKFVPKGSDIEGTLRLEKDYLNKVYQQITASLDRKYQECEGVVPHHIVKFDVSKEG